MRQEWRECRSEGSAAAIWTRILERCTGINPVVIEALLQKPQVLLVFAEAVCEVRQTRREAEGVHDGGEPGRRVREEEAVRGGLGEGRVAAAASAWRRSCRRLSCVGFCPI